MKRLSSAASLALATLAVLGITSAAFAGEQVPFKGTLEGSFTVIMVPPPEINRVLDATGNATQLGDFAYDFPHTVDRSVMPATGDGIATFTAANGDQVFALIHGEATLFAPFVLLGVEEGDDPGGHGSLRKCLRKLRHRTVD